MRSEAQLITNLGGAFTKSVINDKVTYVPSSGIRIVDKYHFDLFVSLFLTNPLTTMKCLRGLTQHYVNCFFNCLFFSLSGIAQRRAFFRYQSKLKERNIGKKNNQKISVKWGTECLNTRCNRWNLLCYVRDTV